MSTTSVRVLRRAGLALTLLAGVAGSSMAAQAASSLTIPSYTPADRAATAPGTLSLRGKGEALVGRMAFVIHRLALLVPTVLGVTIITFFMIHLIPGDPARTMRSRIRSRKAHVTVSL